MLQKLQDYETVKPRDFNRLVDMLDRVLNMSASSPLEISKTSGFNIRLAQKGFPAVITEVTEPVSPGDPYIYAVAEVQPTNSGDWVTLTGGRTLTSVTEWNDLAVAVDTVVWVKPEDDGSWRFNYAGIGLGCYLKRETDPETGELTKNVTLDLTKLIQPSKDTGLKVVETDHEDPDAPRCNWISVNPGCGAEIIEGTNQLSVRLEDLIRTDGSNYCGRASALAKCTPSSGCPFLYVNTTCGIEVDNATNSIRVKLSDLIRTDSFNSCGTASGLAVCTPGEGCNFLYVNPGCGIRVDSTNKVRVWLPDMVGYGLEIDEEEPCQFNVYPGCGIYIDEEGRTAVKLSELISSSSANSCGVSSAIGICTPTPSGCPFLFVKTGCGIRTVGDRLTWYPIDVVDTTRGLEILTTDGCTQIGINYGCGLHLVDGQLQFYANQAAGDGLRAQDDCTLQVFPGCGIYVDSEGRTAVNLDDLIRTTADNSCGTASGLAVCDTSSGCPFIYINTGCGVTVDSLTNKLKLKLDDIAGAGIEVEVPEEGCSRLRLKNPVCFRYLDDISAECDGEGNINFTKTYKYFTGWGTVSDAACP